MGSVSAKVVGHADNDCSADLHRDRTILEFLALYSGRDSENMNYSVLLFGGAMIFSLLFWGVWGRKVYVGPILEMDGRTVGAF